MRGDLRSYGIGVHVGGLVCSWVSGVWCCSWGGLRVIVHCILPNLDKPVVGINHIHRHSSTFHYNAENLRLHPFFNREGFIKHNSLVGVLSTGTLLSSCSSNSACGLCDSPTKIGGSDNNTRPSPFQDMRSNSNSYR
jgi:hypothetical protein